MQKGDIVTVFSLAGEIVGKYINGKDGEISLEDPRVLMQNEQGLGFAKGVCVSGQLQTRKITISNYVFITPTNEEFQKAYVQAVTGLVI
jgi:hypothetical protein